MDPSQLRPRTTNKLSERVQQEKLRFYEQLRKELDWEDEDLNAQLEASSLAQRGFPSASSPTTATEGSVVDPLLEFMVLSTPASRRLQQLQQSSSSAAEEAPPTPAAPGGTPVRSTSSPTAAACAAALAVAVIAAEVARG
eukprot:RCo037086